MKTGIELIAAERERQIKEHTGYCDGCAQLLVVDLSARGNELAACLKKYQARYAEAAHAKKDHTRSAEALRQWAQLDTATASNTFNRNQTNGTKL